MRAGNQLVSQYESESVDAPRLLIRGRQVRKHLVDRMEHISHLPVKVPQILASDLLVPGRASPNVGAVGAFLDAEEAHARKNLPLRHEGDSNNGGRQDEIGKLPKPIPFLEEDVESV